MSGRPVPPRTRRIAVNRLLTLLTICAMVLGLTALLGPQAVAAAGCGGGHLADGVACANSVADPPHTDPPAKRIGTPVDVNGRLHVCGVHLCNQYDRPVQLRGMSTHGIQWFGKCYNAASLDALAEEWNADLLRVAMYVQEGGYETDPAGFTGRVNGLVDMAEARGMYAMVDFHILTPGDPNNNLDRAKTFFASVAARNADKKNVIYEIANEPNGVGWTAIKNYAEQVIPVIRAADPDAVIVVGTRGWSSLGTSDGSNENEVVNNPVRADNIMYAFHFYAASHKDPYRATLSRAASQLPLFVTEFGTVSATGGGAMDRASTTAWLDLLDQLRIGYANWTYSDADESSAAFRPGTCDGGDYSGSGVLTESGALIKNRISTPDSFPTG
ncbi:glycoside hydrolase family 5 protein [Streptomyces sp. NPDC059913]|uniref:glycoside hydrolase family 5 protein n=1 Tax=unclassified Streptomyces TaxID=2593676 RepID=UPI00364ACA07